jgi:2-(1,2-epoxy-1,2-dihydrophenyl)acetyl-CoA isomerase
MKALNDLENLNFELADGVATVTLNRPEAANGLNIPLAQDLLKVAIACEASTEVRAVLLTGAGKMFCGGGDINSFAEAGEHVSEMITELTSYLHSAIARLRHMRAPVVVAVNGTAAGAGFSLALLGDYVIASEKAKFTMAYTGIGLSPDGSASYFLPRLIGLRKTQELMLTNRLLTAAEALEWGMLNKVVAPEEVMPAAQALAKQLAAGPTEAYGAIKQALAVTYANGLEAQMDLETRLIARMSNTEDGKEGVSAFLEKRPPQFNGR